MISIEAAYKILRCFFFLQTWNNSFMSEFISDMISERLQRIMKKALFLLSLRSMLISYNLESKKIHFCFETSLEKVLYFGSKNLHEPCNHIFFGGTVSFPIDRIFVTFSPNSTNVFYVYLLCRRESMKYQNGCHQVILCVQLIWLDLKTKEPVFSRVLKPSVYVHSLEREGERGKIGERNELSGSLGREKVAEPGVMPLMPLIG